MAGKRKIFIFFVYTEHNLLIKLIIRTTPLKKKLFNKTKKFKVQVIILFC